MLLNKIRKVTAVVMSVAMSAAMLAPLTACSSKEKIEKPDKLGDGIVWEKSMELSYATEFSVDYYVKEGTEVEYKLFSIVGDAQYLLIPEGEKVPDELPQDIKPISSPKAIYLVATQTMDMFNALEAMDQVKYSPIQEKDWYIPEAARRMKSGQIKYAGKYSAPDYEMIVSGGCDLAIENTMIYHTPEVKEQLESFDIPVMVDHSSYEKHPFGRMEWVKLYGALMNKEEKASGIYEEQIETFKQLNKPKETPKVAFFYIAANGSVKIRKANDYIPKMIQMAGGEYILDDAEEHEENKSSTVNITMEEFYSLASEADFIIYNSTVEGEMETLEELKAKHKLIASLKAVKNGNVFCTSQNVYQSTMEIGTIIEDINKMLSYNDDMKYIFKLK